MGHGTLGHRTCGQGTGGPEGRRTRNSPKAKQRGKDRGAHKSKGFSLHDTQVVSTPRRRAQRPREEARATPERRERSSVVALQRVQLATTLKAAHVEPLGAASARGNVLVRTVVQVVPEAEVVTLRVHGEAVGQKAFGHTPLALGSLQRRRRREDALETRRQAFGQLCPKGGVLLLEALLGRLPPLLLGRRRARGRRSWREAWEKQGHWLGELTYNGGASTLEVRWLADEEILQLRIYQGSLQSGGKRLEV